MKQELNGNKRNFSQRREHVMDKEMNLLELQALYDEMEEENTFEKGIGNRLGNAEKRYWAIPEMKKLLENVRANIPQKQMSESEKIGVIYQALEAMFGTEQVQDWTMENFRNLLRAVYLS